MKRLFNEVGPTHNPSLRIRVKRDQWTRKGTAGNDFTARNYKYTQSSQNYDIKDSRSENELWKAVLQHAQKVQILAKTPCTGFDTVGGVDHLPNPHYTDRWRNLYEPKVASQSERTTTASRAYPKRKLVGSGTYGSVYWTESPSKRIVALKRINVPQETLTGLPIAAVREWMILQRLNHKNIVSLLDIIPGEDDERDLIADDDKIYHKVFLQVAEEFQREKTSWALKLLLDQQLDNHIRSEEEKASFYRNCREVLRQDGTLKSFDDRVLEGISKSSKK